MTSHHRKIAVSNILWTTLFVLLVTLIFFASHHWTQNSNTSIRLNPQHDSTTTQVNTYLLKDSAVEFGMSLLGTPYATGGTQRTGFDCSGFVYFVFQHFDIKVPRSSKDYDQFGTEVSLEDIQKGDVLVFKSPTRDEIGHVGIVSKPNRENTEFMHASSGKQSRVIISNLNSVGYKNRYVKSVCVVKCN